MFKKRAPSSFLIVRKRSYQLRAFGAGCSKAAPVIMALGVKSIMKKAVRIAAITISPIVVTIGIAITYFIPEMCSNEIINTITSPDNKSKIILFGRNCGATTGFSTQISIVDNGETLGNEAGNIYIAEGRPSNYSIKWKSNTSVFISEGSKEIFKQEASFNNINIVYE